MQEMHKYEILMDYLKNEIVSGNIPCGTRIPSENELSQRFSLSRFTVRRSIELLTNQGWLEKRHGSGTFVLSRGPVRSRTGTIGVVTTYLDDYIFPSIIHGIEDVLTRSGYAISLGITGNKTEKEALCLHTLLEKGVDGLILEGTKSAFPNPNLELLEEFSRCGIPVVFINGEYPGFSAGCVLMDDEASGFKATEYLLGCGHTRIGGVFKSDDIQGHRRYKGYIRACRCRGVAVDENSIIWYTTEDLPYVCGPDYEAALCRRLRDCTALLCYNDQISARMTETLGHMGRRVPDDISVVGFDNSDLCEVSSVKLTSVTHARHEMGQKAASLLLTRIAEGNRGEPALLRLPSALVVRDSVRRINP